MPTRALGTAADEATQAEYHSALVFLHNLQPTSLCGWDGRRGGDLETEADGEWESEGDDEPGEEGEDPAADTHPRVVRVRCNQHCFYTLDNPSQSLAHARTSC